MNLGRGAAFGVLAGVASGAVFGILMSAAMSALLSIYVNLEIVVLYTTLGGAIGGLPYGLLYSHAIRKLRTESDPKTAIGIAVAFSILWGVSWFVILSPSFSIGSNGYAVFIHKLGIETPWVQIPTSSGPVVDLIDISLVGGYVVAYSLLSLLWAMLLALVLSQLIKKWAWE